MPHGPEAPERSPGVSLFGAVVFGGADHCPLGPPAPRRPYIPLNHVGCDHPAPLRTVTSSAITATLSSSSASSTIGWYAGFVGESTIRVCRQLLSSAAAFSDEYRLTVNAPPVSGSAGPRYCASTVLPCRVPVGLARNTM